MENWVEKINGGTLMYFFCPGVDETKGGKPGLRFKNII